MRVVLDDGSSIDLGETDAAPTIGISDFSRRETNDFGVTTVVPRGFARRMSVKLIVPFDQVDALQRQLADLRATPVRWVADDRYSWLDFRGFYKDFAIDLNVPPISYCTLTVEGLAATEDFVDPGTDPAPGDEPSKLMVVQPVVLGTDNLLASNVPENDYPEWSAGTNYSVGARVIKAATHRIYESGAASNVGNDPAGASGKWTDIGPTNRWAMFDQALGSETSSAAAISVTIGVGVVDALVLLNVTATTVRVQTQGFDRTAAPNASGTVSFLDLPATSAAISVTIAGSGTKSIGTLLVGKLVGLGHTESSPSASISDFSRKETDDFGEVTVVERAWAKRMSVKAVLRTDAIDLVANRIAAVRGRPALWIGADGIEALTIYGFFSDFSIAVDTMISRLSLTVEGLSTAGKVEPFTASAAWPDVTDPLGTKPDNNADVTGENTSKDTMAVGGVPALEVTGGLQAVEQTIDDIDELTQGLLAKIGVIPEGATVVELINDIEASDIGGNLISSSDFANGTSGFALITSTPQFFNWGIDNADDIAFPGAHYMGLLGLRANGDDDAAVVSQWVAVLPGQWAQASADLASRECTAAIRIQWGDAAGNYLSNGPATPAVKGPNGSNNLDGFERRWCKGQAPADARFMRLVLEKGPYLANQAGNLSWAFMLRPMLALATEGQTAPTNYKPSGGGAGLSDARARIEEVRLAAASDTNAVVTRTETLEASYGSTAPGNLIPSSDFANGKAGFDLITSTPASFSWGVNNAGFTVAGERYFGLLCLEPNGDRAADIVSGWMAVRPGQWVQGSADLAARECFNNIRLQWGGGDGSFLSEGPSSEIVGAPFTGWENLDGWKRVWCKGLAPSGARFVRLVLHKGQYLANQNNFLSWLFAMRPMVAITPAEPNAPAPYTPRGGGAGLTAAQAQLTETAQLAAANGQAVGQLQQILQVTAGGQSARLNDISQVATDAFDRVSGARWSKEAVAGNGRAQLTVYAFDNNGNLMSGVDIIGDLTISGNLIVSGSIITGKLQQNAVTATSAMTQAGNLGAAFQLTHQPRNSESTLQITVSGVVDVPAGSAIRALGDLYIGGVLVNAGVRLGKNNQSNTYSLTRLWGGSNGPVAVRLETSQDGSSPDGPGYVDCTIVITELKR
ncbi:hypothetical protein HNO88_001574 [Novosphingobium chloroacetimidivorans]|uniref:Uncharacterized protein n=1 Tax=Novosphingobium chloroacetimidivorans TaxID=1428314 RepID=A0A7W7K956_9SPHN|nr:hypothetical protein [Novosphingobium chloroacetimidivorans]MBB4858255.1 hypothetical protein [Novosphingobium chloroacetimidivorans]